MLNWPSKFLSELSRAALLFNVAFFSRDISRPFSQSSGVEFDFPPRYASSRSLFHAFSLPFALPDLGRPPAPSACVRVLDLAGVGCRQRSAIPSTFLGQFVSLWYRLRNVYGSSLWPAIDGLRIDCAFFGFSPPVWSFGAVFPPLLGIFPFRCAVNGG